MGLRGFGECFEVSFSNGSKSFKEPGMADGPSCAGAEAIRISSTFFTCGGAVFATLGLAGAGLGGGGRLGKDVLSSLVLGTPSDRKE